MSIQPEIVYLCECKHWARAVPQSIVDGFRTVVQDYGANWGIIISLKGFQKGAYHSARNSNIKLLSWLEFQDLFEDRWIQNYFIPTLSAESDVLIEYTEPINSRIFRKADLLSIEKKNNLKFYVNGIKSYPFL